MDLSVSLITVYVLMCSVFEGCKCEAHCKELDVGVGVHAEGWQSAAVLLQDHVPGTLTALILQERCRDKQEMTIKRLTS